jgi:HlyD family secretion protein
MKRILVPLIVAAVALTTLLLVYPKDENGTLTLSGVLEATEVEVASRVPGRVVYLSAEEGETVDSGAVVARLSIEDLPARQSAASAGARAAEAALRQAEAALEQARMDAVRYERLYEQEIVPESQVEAFRTALEIADANHRAAVDQLAAARAGTAVVAATEKETEVIAPITGTVLLRLREQGEVAAAGVPLYVLADLSRLELVVYVPEPHLSKVAPGDSAQVYVDAFPDVGFPAVVSRVADVAEFTPRFVQTKQTRVDLVFAVTLRLENPDGRLRPGMPADAVFAEQR